MSNINKDELIGSSNGEMNDENIVFQSNSAQYLKIEDKIQPESFYDLSTLSIADRFRPVKIQARIGIMPYSLMSSFRMQAMKMAEADFIRGIVSIGIIALCRQKNINSDLIGPTIKLYSGQRTISMDKRFNVTLELLDFHNTSTIAVVDGIVCGRPRNDKYGVLLWNKLHPVWSKKTPDYYKPKKWIICPELLKKCRAFVKNGLSDKMYELSAKVKNSQVDSQNPSITIRISRRFSILSYEYSKYYGSGKLPGQLYRGYFVAGLYILSKWAIQKKLSNYEYFFKQMIHDLEIQACTKQASV
jgi:hypothetical protein